MNDARWFVAMLFCSEGWGAEYCFLKISRKDANEVRRLQEFASTLHTQGGGYGHVWKTWGNGFVVAHDLPESLEKFKGRLNCEEVVACPYDFDAYSDTDMDPGLVERAEGAGLEIHDDAVYLTVMNRRSDQAESVNLSSAFAEMMG